MSESWRRSVDAWLSTHLGIISAAKLVEFGCGTRNISYMVDRHVLVTMLPGVFRSAQWPCHREQRLAALCARNESAAIAFTTAGQLWSWRRMADPVIHVLVPHGVSPEMPDVVVHRCRRIDPVDIVQRSDGIRLTSPPRTIFDCADMIGLDATASVLEQLLNEQGLTFGTITDTVQRLYHPNRPGSKTILAVIQSRPAWRVALQSDLEFKVLEEMSRQGLAAPVTQYRVRPPGYDHDVAIDFAWPSVKLAIEVDHPAWHDGSIDSHTDKGRDRKLATIGWATSRITDIDVNSGLRSAVADVGEILARLTAAAA
jgi:very-short-patch-repair endonuclease